MASCSHTREDQLGDRQTKIGLGILKGKDRGTVLG